MTEWRQHPYIDHIEVSDDGRVRSTDRFVKCKNNGMRLAAGRELSQHICSGGYPTVMSRRRVHVLVCETFHGLNVDPKLEVRHLNGIKTDNRSSNLAWGTRRENMLDLTRHGGNQRANQTHCKYGHEMTVENTAFNKRGHRNCIACQRYRSSNRYYVNGVRTSRGVTPK